MANNYGRPGFWTGVGENLSKTMKDSSNWLESKANTGMDYASNIIDQAGARVKDVASGDFSGKHRPLTQAQKDEVITDEQLGYLADMESEGDVVTRDQRSFTGATDAGGGLGYHAMKTATDEAEGSGINWAMAFSDTADALAKMDSSPKATSFAPSFRPSFRPTQIDDSIQKAQLANTNQMDINAILKNMSGGVSRGK